MWHICSLKQHSSLRFNLTAFDYSHHRSVAIYFNRITRSSHSADVFNRDADFVQFISDNFRGHINRHSGQIMSVQFTHIHIINSHITFCIRRIACGYKRDPDHTVSIRRQRNNDLTPSFFAIVGCNRDLFL